jgi:hypothetical protein
MSAAAAPPPPPPPGGGPPKPPGGGGPAGPGPTGALVRVTSDPNKVLPNSSRFIQISGPFTLPGSKVQYLRCRLTRAGNQALRELCHTAIQREVWSWPTYEFYVKATGTPLKPVIRAEQVRPSLLLSYRSSY